MQERFERFTVLVSKISRLIRKIKTEEVKKYQLRSQHVYCVYYVYKSEALTATELCELCNEDKGAISRTIDFLEEKGLIAIDKEENKRYKLLIRLTEEGKKIGEEISQRVEEILSKVGNKITEKERELMYQGLSQICDDLEKITKYYND